MRKILTVFALIFVLSIAGCAFAAGHGGVDNGYVTPDTKSSDVTVPDGSGVVVVSVAPITKDAAQSDVSVLANAIGENDSVNIYAGITIDISHDATERTMNITVANSGVADKDVNSAYIGRKADSTKYDKFNVTVTGGNLVIEDVPINDYFSSAKVYFANTVTSGGDSGSSGGCNAGFAGMFLLAAVPLCFFRRK